MSTYQVYLGSNIICGEAAVHLAFLIKDLRVSGVSITSTPGAFRKPAVIWLYLSFVFHMTKMTTLHTWFEGVAASHSTYFLQQIPSFFYF